jgi:cytochrome c1
MNNCMGCHSLKFQRYNRTAKDLEIPAALLTHSLLFTANKIGELMDNQMSIENSEKWFGTAPPDLSLIARSRGTNWLYNYLRAFYKDPLRPYGINNSVFVDVGMPHALENMQGIQDKTEEVKGIENDISYANKAIASARNKIRLNPDSDVQETIIYQSETLINKKQLQLVSLSEQKKYFTLIKKGSLNPKNFDESMIDLVNFLDYIGEPIKRERKKMGVSVLLFILFFTLLAYFLKKEYWKDIS